MKNADEMNPQDLISHYQNFARTFLHEAREPLNGENGCTVEEFVEALKESHEQQNEPEFQTALNSQTLKL